MHTENGLSLMESLVAITILTTLATGYSKTNEYLNRLRAHRLCSNIEYYLNNLKFISDHKNDTSTLLVKSDLEILGLTSGKKIFREFSSPIKVGIKTGASSPNSIQFYPNNSSSPGSISVGPNIENTLEPLCAISVSLRGRIRKFNYDK